MLATSPSRIPPLLRALAGCLAVVLSGAAALAAEDVAAVRQLLIRGEYEKVVAVATAEMGTHADELEWVRDANGSRGHGAPDAGTETAD